MRHHIREFVCLAGLMLAARGAGACDVPVFRYALEYWPPGDYTATVFHRGPLAGEAKTARDTLASAAPRLAMNLQTEDVDLNVPMTPENQTLWNSQTGAVPPWVVLQFPAGGLRGLGGGDWDGPPPADTATGTRSAWSGPLTAATAAAMLDSPARQSLVKSLMEGASAVWVVIPGRNPKADAEAVARLKSGLSAAAQQVELPPAGESGIPLSTNVPLKVAFPVLRVAPDDPREAMFVAALRRSQSPAVGDKDTAVFPVFGRGRIIAALTGEEINADNVLSAVEFICGACSCMVKDENPGIDLPVAMDWESALGERQIPEDPEVVGLAAVAEGTDQAATSAPPALATPVPQTAGAPSAQRSPLGRNVVVAGAGILALVLLGTAVALRRR